VSVAVSWLVDLSVTLASDDDIIRFGPETIVRRRQPDGTEMAAREHLSPIEQA
jgi:hypothetical protein